MGPCRRAVHGLLPTIDCFHFGYRQHFGHDYLGYFRRRDYAPSFR